MSTQTETALLPSPATGYQIRIATTPQERKAIARLRYEVYVEEMGRVQPHANHGAREIHEPLDDEGFVLGAFLADGTATATLRVTPAQSKAIEYREVYGWGSRELGRARMSCLATKFIVSPDRRGQLVAIDLIRNAAREAVRRGWRFVRLDSNEHLVPLYARLGFRTQHQCTHELYGQVTVMELDLLDSSHLKTIRSPLVRDHLESLVPAATVAA